MINNEHMKEFGFEGVEKFPRLLLDHEVTISLPSAMAHQVKPATVIIEKGVAIPVQMPGVPNGMIIRHDGKMVYVAHQNPQDFSSPLQAVFTDDISYDVRLEAFNIMRRAVEVDWELKDIWTQILNHWVKWFPPFIKEINAKKTGSYANIQDAFQALEKLIDKFMIDISSQIKDMSHVPLKFVVQTVVESEKGWQGEEFLVDDITAGQIMLVGSQAYCRDRLKIKLRRILKNPVFSSHSSFELYYEPRLVPVVKLVIISSALDSDFDQFAAGIDLE